MRLLDLFCGAGGCAIGYHRAGFAEIVGVDIKPQNHYPFEFVQGDALEYVALHGRKFDVIHASPPCQQYSVTRNLSNGNHPDLVEDIRASLQESGKPYIIENVPGSPLVNPLVLCGTMFNLRVIRHRLFECDPVIWFPPYICNHWGKTSSSGRGKSIENPTGYIRGSFEYFDFITVVGHDFVVSDARIAMGIDWMTGRELSQAIPPAYTEWLGGQILEAMQ